MQNSLNIEAKYPIWLTLFVVVIMHFLFIWLPSVNLEFSFVDAAGYFQSNNQLLLDRYFYFQANTLVLPFIASFAASFLTNWPMLIVLRAINVLGVLLIGVGVVKICKFLGRHDYWAILCIVLLNPLIWTFSGRATADFFPTAIGIFAISLLLDEGNSKYKVLMAALLFGLAVILKYHTLCMLVFLSALFACRGGVNRHIFKLATMAIVGIATLGIYLLVVHYNYGFWITPEKHQSVLKMNVISIPMNFAYYLGFIILLVAPIALITSEMKMFFMKYWRLLLVGCLLIFTAGYCGLSDLGEMNLGPIDKFISGEFRSGFVAVMAGIFIFQMGISIFHDSSAYKHKKYLSLATIIVILGFSLIRPTQRYLMPVFPFFVMVLPALVVRWRSVFTFTICLFLVLDTFIGYSQWCSGGAADTMIHEIERRGLLEVTDGDAILTHVGDHFKLSEQARRKEYVVINGDSPSAIISSHRGFSIFQKSFALVPISAAVRSN